MSRLHLAIMAVVVYCANFVSAGQFSYGFAPIPAPIGDLNHDGEVSFEDLSLVIFFWGHIGAVDADLNGDQVVNFADVILLLANWT